MRLRRWGVPLFLVMVVCASGDRVALALADPFQIFTSLAGLVLLLAGRPTFGEVVALAAGTVVLFPLHRVLLQRVGILSVSPSQSLQLVLGLSSTLVLAFRARRTAKQEDSARFLLAITILAFVSTTRFCLALTVWLCPWVKDNIIMALDADFGGEASFAVGRFAVYHPAFKALLTAVYALLPVALSVVASKELSSGRKGRGAFEVFIAAGAVGFVLYLVFPVVGPRPLFGGGFPLSPIPSLPLIPVDAAGIGAARNCMPSLHTAWALLLYWHARPFGFWWKAGGAAWLGFTALATLGLGQHYLLDLIVALPVAGLVDALVDGAAGLREGRRRRQLVMVSASSVVLWYAVLFTAAMHEPAGALVLALTVATTTATWIAHARWTSVAVSDDAAAGIPPAARAA